MRNYNFFESIDSDISPMIVPQTSMKPSSSSILRQGILVRASNGEMDSLRTLKYFILDNQYLWCQSKREDKEFNWALKMSHIKIAISQTDNILPTEDSKRFMIKLCYGEKSWVLFAQSSSDYNEWIRSLSSVSIRTDLHSRFKVSKIIGSGAFAKVYEGQEKRSKTSFAIKGFSKKAVEQGFKGKLSLDNEISILRTLSHKNLSNLIEVHETTNSIYLVFDLYSGGELHQFLKSKRFIEENEVRMISIGLLRGVLQLSEQNLVHRDLKPANIMLRKNVNIQPEDVVIVDFGLCTYANKPDPIFCRCGTPGHVAPEIIESSTDKPGFTVHSISDMFSIGVIMFTMMTGLNPFEGEPWVADQVLRKNLDCQINWKHPHLSNYSRDLISLVSQMLKKKPEDRISAIKAIQLISNSQLYEDIDGIFSDDIDEFTTAELETRNIRFGSYITTEKKSPMSSAQKPKPLEALECFSSLNSIVIGSRGSFDLNEGLKVQGRIDLYKQSLIGRTSKDTKDEASSKNFFDTLNSPLNSSNFDFNANVSLFSGPNTPNKIDRMEGRCNASNKRVRKKSAFGPDLGQEKDREV